MKTLFVLLILIIPLTCFASDLKTENVLLITLDGLRWQELFSGADDQLIRNDDYVHNPDMLVKRFWADDAGKRRSRLMPFFWSVIVEQGQLYGNRELNSKANLTNNMWFSYPGYNEILTGAADDRIDSNDKNWNRNITVLEFVNRQAQFKGRVAAFGSWDVFPYIINEKRSGVPVNAGFESATGDDLNSRELFLNQLQKEIPSPWGSVRLDAFTHHFAFEYLKKHKPRLLYIAYGETDDFAHDKDYQQYLISANRTDRFIKELWEWLQSKPQYQNRTTLVITTDHGRGDGDEWTDHGTDTRGSDATWIAVIGPDTPANGEKTPGQVYNNQVAATVATLLGLTFEGTKPAGSAIKTAIRY
jgi:hypothetical protein